MVESPQRNSWHLLSPLWTLMSVTMIDYTHWLFLDVIDIWQILLLNGHTMILNHLQLWVLVGPWSRGTLLALKVPTRPMKAHLFVKFLARPESCCDLTTLFFMCGFSGPAWQWTTSWWSCERVPKTVKAFKLLDKSKTGSAVFMSPTV